MRIRGKNLSVNQRKILLKHGFSNDTVNSYQMKSIKWLEDGKENLSKFGEKQEVWTIINKTTGEIKEVIIGGK